MSIKCSRKPSIATLLQSVTGSLVSTMTISAIVANAPCPGRCTSTPASGTKRSGVQTGRQNPWLLFLIEGSVELRRFTRAGQTVIIHRAHGGETFAEASLFSQSFHCDALVTSKSHLVELDRHVILEKFYDEPEFALAIARRFAVQNQHYRRKLELLAIKNAEDRIFTAIIDWLLTGTIKAFASDIGLTHEAVYRGLANLVKRGLLVKSGRGKYSSL